MSASRFQDPSLRDSINASRNVTSRFPGASAFPISLNKKVGGERRKVYFCSTYLMNARNCTYKRLSDTTPLNLAKTHKQSKINPGSYDSLPRFRQTV